MLGGYDDRIPAYIAGGYYEEGKGWDMLQSEMKENLKRGAKAVKMKIGGASIKEDLERVDAVRDAVGPDIHLLVDANNAYNRIDALKMGRSWSAGTYTGLRSLYHRMISRAVLSFRENWTYPLPLGRMSIPDGDLNS